MLSPNICHKWGESISYIGVILRVFCSKNVIPVGRNQNKSNKNQKCHIINHKKSYLITCFPFLLCVCALQLELPTDLQKMRVYDVNNTNLCELIRFHLQEEN